ncbi:hypothetical protein ACFLYU_01585 [Candidatus Dependentiae bacterium]
MYKKRYFTPLLIVLLFSSKAFSNIYDNRFFPLYKRPYTKEEDKYSRFGTSFFAMAADWAMGVHDEEIRIPRIFGCYDEEKIGQALVLLGKPNPLRDEFQNVNLPWIIDQKINAQGMSFVYDQHIWKYLYGGLSFMFMRVHSNYSFIFDREKSGLKLTDRELSDVYDSLCNLHNAIGICGRNYNQTGFGDMDFYLKLGNVWDYLYKMWRIDAGFSLGFLIPTGKERCLDIPASIPFGGNGHWGMYGQIDLELGLKEDMRLLLMFRMSKRKTKTKMQRLPIAKEHPLFGALIAPVEVSPGLTFVFAPQFWWENLRKGFGLRLGYTLVYHNGDTWKDCRSEQARENIKVDLGCINEASEWASDYINLSAYYEFYDEADEKKFAPILSLTWDWPTFFFVGKRTPKTHRISLGLDVLF